ncbi:hypothetical protein EN828_09595 [Mesorhizobium sp. M2D.F.Ca.ET.185.01.1.1]|uniref:hypothetical protein n=1 Tax=unclassified Mesorhizobium TaxID=325217 RepID=UPI000FCB2840|nr:MULTISPECIES: hypothetical protein [unclassified Mesorhizobium]TGP55672.1 hypothetical protein EN873_09850 [bacterium M00.F.Ca.ET.230.01.1.1]TGP82827.1 hypothetical protein EN870_06190 [bacterium M00.F.Ca.ET.227.01.1.1]TGP94569.1 hypothetical protein EN864_14110 [bacterium M00.F.Ca.ET.221.01.1.1]TGP98023.1 hypothetical protein EN865_10335 [bacterium M00.F.Ca.ET.222.01.1.1]TGT74866.1 hypothetical protein EN802_07530 [bacterium M00.F.Ca.ET.159.01.1.1]TGT87734.1 hypothetical protein EN800_044
MTRKADEVLSPEELSSRTRRVEREITLALDAFAEQDAPSRMVELARKLDTAIALRARKSRPN